MTDKMKQRKEMKMMKKIVKMMIMMMKCSLFLEVTQKIKIFMKNVGKVILLIWTCLSFMKDLQ